MARTGDIDPIVDEWIGQDEPMTIDESHLEGLDTQHPDYFNNVPGGVLLSEAYLSELRNTRGWVNQAFSDSGNLRYKYSAEGIPEEGYATYVETAVDYDPDHGWMIFPIVRQSESGKALHLELDSAKRISKEKGDFITVPSGDIAQEVVKGLNLSLEREAELISRDSLVEDKDTGLLRDRETFNLFDSEPKSRTEILAENAESLINATKIDKTFVAQPSNQRDIAVQSIQDILGGISALIGANSLGLEGESGGEGPDRPTGGTKRSILGEISGGMPPNKKPYQ
tara:strand:+ start:2312 stop:3160 length:849 start_codon:yes stop_codon:yes gene_type:complete